MKKISKPYLWFFILVLLISACSDQTPSVVTETVSPPLATATPTISEPTPTPVPAAAIVNGERIPLAWFESELARYLRAQEALEGTVNDMGTAREVVINDLIDQVLLAQAAVASGGNVADVEVQARVDALEAEVDLDAWMTAWGYTEEDLFKSLKLQMLGAYQRESVVSAVPEIMPQVELRQVFAYTKNGADRALVSLNSGRTFDEVAFEYDPVTGGYLGWVPRGYLLIPELEDAAFSLQVGAYSAVIESEIGYHILFVLNNEDHPLSSDAKLTLQRQALHDWLSGQRANSTIEVLIDSDE